MKRALFILLLLALPAWADSISLPFSGTAVYGDDAEMFNLVGSDSSLSLFSTFPGSTDRILPSPLPELAIHAYPGGSAGQWLSIVATSLVGDIDFSAPVDGLVTLSGELWGYAGNKLVFAISLAGSGSVVLGRDGRQVSYAFSGTATDPPIVPEPSTWLLVATGLIPLWRRFCTPPA